jgi:hypothetical protein
VIKRELLLENGAVISRIEGDYFGEGAEQIAGRPAFETWLAEIRDLDRQMREVMGAATGREPRPATD